MSLRKIIEGRLAPLTMSGTGAGDPPPAGGGGGTSAVAVAPAALTFAPDKPFVDQLPEKYRTEAAFKDIKDFDGLASGFLNAQRMIGDRVALPKDGDEKGWGELFNKLGRPESFDKYNVGKRADGSDYGDQDKAFHAKILPALHQAGVTQTQLDKIRPAFDALMGEAAGAGTKAAEAYAAQQQDGLKKEWGAAYDDNMAAAQDAIRHLGNDELIAELNIVKDGKATGDNAQLLKVMAKIGKQLREDGVLKGDGGAPLGGAMAPADAKARIDKLMASNDFKDAYRKKGATGKDLDGKAITHEEAVAEMQRLYAFAYPPQE